MSSNKSRSIQTAAPAALFVITLLATSGCAGPGPKLFPVGPIEQSRAADGRTERLYDLDGDGQADWVETLGPDGMVAALRWDPETPPEVWPPLTAGTRNLLIILDSVPFDMVREIRDQGRFRLFYPPARIVAPFPVMTDLSLDEFFGISPTPAIETQYYNGRRLTNGYWNYGQESNSLWLDFVDYHLPYAMHIGAYLHPLKWYGHELRRIGERYQRSDSDPFIGYSVGTSALGASEGRDGHQAALVRLDRFCQQLVYESSGGINITLMSDHGHNLVSSRLIPLRQVLHQLGYRENERLADFGDAVVPEFGVVTMAAVYTTAPRAVARDLVGVEGIDLTMYRDNDAVVVLSRDGEATVRKRGDQYRYTLSFGDPLKLNAIFEELARSHQLSAEGYADDRVLFDVTKDHVYPDALHRVWRAFHGLMKSTPHVLVSVKDGWHCGAELMSDALDLAAAHGNLGYRSTSGFAMSTAGALPPVVRMEDLAGALAAIGVPIQRSTGAPPDAVAQSLIVRAPGMAAR